MKVGEVSQLWRYPVKSMGGEQLPKIHIGENGVPGDRAWAVRDEDRGGIRGAKRFPELMNQSARYLEEPALEGSSPAQISLSSGEVLATGDDGAAAKLSAVLGSKVTLWPLMPKTPWTIIDAAHLCWTTWKQNSAGCSPVSPMNLCQICQFSLLN